MSDVRELLDGIEKRAADGPVSDWDPRGGDEPHHRVIDRTIEFEKRLRADNARLVAALRAVLDLHHETVDGLCSSCFEPDVQTDEALVVFYPCPTVPSDNRSPGW